MPICYIVSAMPLARVPHRTSDDLIIAADLGFRRLSEVGVSPDLTVGDFDSLPDAPTENVLSFPKRKDDTDTLLAIREGLARGYRRFLLYGADGGFFDHAYANIQALALLRERDAFGIIFGMREDVALLTAGDALTFQKPKAEKRFSVFAYGGDAEVTLEGLSYSGESILLTDRHPLGVGNLFLDTDARIRVTRGRVLVASEVEMPFPDGFPDTRCELPL